MSSYNTLKSGLLSNSRSRIYASKRDDERQFAVAVFFLVASLFLSSSLMMIASSWAPDASSPPLPAKVCLVTADFWGAPAAGGTATAFELLARELQKEQISATLVGVSSSCESREKFIAAHRDLKSSAFLCKEYLDTPLEKETFPYEIAGLLALQWLRSQASHCDIVHWHEWGGVAVPSLVASETGFLHANMRHVVQLHGGNLWASQHGPRPVHDMTALRIDANEKLSIELAHELTSPSKYMADWYGARGWKLPEKVSVVPNCLSLPSLPFISSTQEPLIKAIKAVAFFGRLESRKGIEIFFDAISLLGDDILSKPDFKVLIIGGSAQIRSQRSEVWIQTRIKSLPSSLNASQVVLKVGLSREMALKEILEAETIISFGSMIENAPFALVEASKLGLPYVALDTGGVQEVVDLESSSASVLFNPLNLTETTVALASALEVRLRAGNAAVPKLRPNYEQGDTLWIKWHEKAAQELKQVVAPKNPERIGGSSSSRRAKLLFENPPTTVKSEIMHVGDGTNALIKLHNDACGASHGDPSQILLLVPTRAVEINEAAWRQQLLPTLAAKLDRKLHAVSLGVTVKNSNKNASTMAFAGSPTWTYYSNQTLCTPAAPLAIRRKTLCNLRLLSRNFQRSDAWTLSLLIKKAGMEVATLPVSEVAVLKEWQVNKCLPENPPEWSFDHDITANLRYDPQIALFKDLATLGKAPEPLASFFSDSRHWKIFPKAARTQDCDAPQLVPPYFCGNILHPSKSTSVYASFKSWFALDGVDLWAELRACPSCAEGPLAVQVVLVRNTQENKLIWSHEFDAGGACDSKVLYINELPVNAGDEIRLVAAASSADGHSCAGIYVPAFDIYPRISH